MMEQGPVLVIMFNAQQVMCVKDKTGKVIEGNDEKVMRMTYVWALCRDQTELDPKAAWRLLDLSASSQEQFIWKLNFHRLSSSYLWHYIINTNEKKYSVCRACKQNIKYFSLFAYIQNCVAHLIGSVNKFFKLLEINLYF